MTMFFKVFFLIFSIKIGFLLPPPQTKTLQSLLSTFDKREVDRMTVTTAGPGDYNSEYFCGNKNIRHSSKPRKSRLIGLSIVKKI